MALGGPPPARCESTAYSSLKGEDCFRTLELYPGTGQDRLKCQLSDARFGDEGVEYEALSYVWGDATTTSHVENLTSSTSSTYMPVASNLHHALLALRRSDVSRMLWIDALCIDQSNVQERGEQVAQMDRIFSKAMRALVWLGPSNDRSRSCIEVMRKLGALVVRASASGTSIEEANVPYPASDETKLLDDFYSRSWFWRLWCVQELVLSKSCLLVWGDATVDWTIVEM